MDGLLEAAQNVEEKQLFPLSGVSEVMDGSSWLYKAYARHGWILQEGEGWFIDFVFPMKVLMASDGQLLGMDSASSPAKLDWMYRTSFIPIGAGKCLQDIALGGVTLQGTVVAALSGHVGLGQDVGFLLYPQTSHG